jgi:hypothetical protein
MDSLFKHLVKIDKHKFLAILSLFLSGQILVSFLFNLKSIVISRGDSTFYFQSANSVLDLNSFERMYAGYIYLLHFSQIFFHSGLLMIIIQSLFVILAAYSLFSVTLEYGGILAAWISTSFYLVFPMLTQWTRYILTDSLFYSMIIIAIRLVTLKSGWVNFAILPLSTFLILIRPNGFLIASAVLTVFILNRTIIAWKRVVIIILIWLFGFFLYTVLIGRGSAEESTIQISIFEKTLEGNVVYGVKELFYKMPTPSTGDRSDLSYLKYFFDYPVDNIKIGLLRIYWELKQTRPWYSINLNIFISVSMISFYCLSAFSLFKIRERKLVTYIGIVTAPSVLLIALTWSIWEGRFGWWFLVSWIPLFGIGAARMVHALSFKIGHKSWI